VTPEEAQIDIPIVLGVGDVPGPWGLLFDSDPELACRAWEQTRPWIDSEFFEESAVLAGAALEVVADEMPPSTDHVRLGALGGSDLPVLDRALEALVQTTPRALIVCLAWHRAITDPGFANPERGQSHPLAPGRARFMRDLPAPRAGHDDLIEATEQLGVARTGVAALRPLLAWPEYLTLVTSELATLVGTAGHSASLERISTQAGEIASRLSAPMPQLSGAATSGADLIAGLAAEYPTLVVIAAFLRLGAPTVARIPRIA
jgi:hypothetical protein